MQMAARDKQIRRWGVCDTPRSTAPHRSPTGCHNNTMPYRYATSPLLCTSVTSVQGITPVSSITTVTTVPSVTGVPNSPQVYIMDVIYSGDTCDFGQLSFRGMACHKILWWGAFFRGPNNGDKCCGCGRCYKRYAGTGGTGVTSVTDGTESRGKDHAES